MSFACKRSVVLLFLTLLGCGNGNAGREEAPIREEINKKDSYALETIAPSASKKGPARMNENESMTQDISSFSTLPSSVYQKMQGKWELVSYQIKDGDDYMEVPITPSPLDLIESWTFKKSSYRRIMDENLSFSASYILLESERRIAMFEGVHFILHAQKVRSSILGVKRPEEFFYGVLSDDSLILFYLGLTMKKEVSLSQGHMYEKK